MKTPKFGIGQQVTYKNQKAIIADHYKGKYLLWNKTGKKELESADKNHKGGWVPEDQLTKGW